jgi:hypothetical protein
MFYNRRIDESLVHSPNDSLKQPVILSSHFPQELATTRKLAADAVKSAQKKVNQKQVKKLFNFVPKRTRRDGDSSDSRALKHAQSGRPTIKKLRRHVPIGADCSSLC